MGLCQPHSRSLSQADFSQVAALLKTVTHEQGLVLQEPGDEVVHIHFPHTGMISLLAVLKDGKAIETATVGREGVVGAMAGLGCTPRLRERSCRYPWLVRKLLPLPSERLCSKAMTSET